MFMKSKKQLRESFKNGVFSRDGHRCKICGKHAQAVKLDAHHIINRNLMPNGGYVLENGITLCDTPDGCHFKAEKFEEILKLKKNLGVHYYTEYGYSDELS